LDWISGYDVAVACASMLRQDLERLPEPQVESAVVGLAFGEIHGDHQSIFRLDEILYDGSDRGIPVPLITQPMSSPFTQVMPVKN